MNHKINTKFKNGIVGSDLKITVQVYLEEKSIFNWTNKAKISSTDRNQKP